MRLLTRYVSPIVLLAAASSSAFAANVRTDYDHSANFTQYHSYSWGQVKTADPFYEDRVRQQVDQDLQAKGWQLLPSGGQTMVFATGNITNEQEVETTYNNFGPGWGGGWGWGGWGWGGGGGFGQSTSMPVNQRVGNLVVDVFDSNSKHLLFRGISSADLSNKADKNTKQLDKDIDKIFSKFPPHSK